MNGGNGFEPRKLTFSQAHGYEDLPRPLQLGELDKKSRVKLWGLLYQHVSDASRWSEFDSLNCVQIWREIFLFIHENLFELTRDVFENDIIVTCESYKHNFMYYPINKIFDLLQEIMRHPECSTEFIQSVADMFEECKIAYVVDIQYPATIVPAATKEEGKAILQATGELSSIGLEGAVTHLRQASDCINRGDFPGAVHESINAVESTARHFDSNATTLEPALKSLERAGVLHPALKRAFSNLYGYTSDEQGIRHALIDNPQANVGQDEAVFMLGACAAFSSYLARKHRNTAS